MSNSKPQASTPNAAFEEKAKDIIETFDWWKDGQDYLPSDEQCRIQLREMIVDALKEAARSAPNMAEQAVGYENGYKQGVERGKQDARSAPQESTTPTHNNEALQKEQESEKAIALTRKLNKSLREKGLLADTHKDIDVEALLPSLDEMCFWIAHFERDGDKDAEPNANETYYFIRDRLKEKLK